MIVIKDMDKEMARLDNLINYERELWERGTFLVAGIDEAGRGPLAGPVVAASVILSLKDTYILGLNDSKKLTRIKRDVLEQEIKQRAICYAVASSDHIEIDAINILQATKLAMKRALKQLTHRPEHLLIDAVTLQDVSIPQTSLIKGDSLSASIAAASILAKCARDRMMEEFDSVYPQYGFAKHKGYPTEEHYRAIANFGACPIHRKSYRLK